MDNLRYPIGISREAMEFEKENKDKIFTWTAETNYRLEEKTVTFILFDKTVYSFTFPFSKII